MKTILWYDLETWDRNVRSTRIAQFAAIRTDLDFNIIQQPIIYYCEPTKDYIPNPHAILVHQLLPHNLPSENVLSELDMLIKIQEHMQQPDTIVAGFNNTRFDNNVLRFSWFRNALDPYALDYKPDNRWDIIDTIRTCHALRPQGINWYTNEDSAISFKLEHLAQANQLQQTKAHDALFDVRATIELAKLIHEKQPKLYTFCFQHREVQKLLSLLHLAKQNHYSPLEFKPPMLIHVSGMIPDHQCRAEIIVPIAFHPQYKNEVIALGLQQEPSELLNLSVEELRHNFFSTNEVLEQENKNRIRSCTLRLKKLPILTPLKALQDDSQWQRIAHDAELCEKHYHIILQNFSTIKEKLLLAYQPPKNQHKNNKDVDLSLYDMGFFSRKDKRLLTLFQQQNWMIKNETHLIFENLELQKICFRTRARNAPQTLNADELDRWQQHCQNCYDEGLATEYSLKNCQQDLAILRKEKLNSKQHSLLDDFEHWLKTNRCTMNK